MATEGEVAEVAPEKLVQEKTEEQSGGQYPGPLKLEKESSGNSTDNAALEVDEVAGETEYVLMMHDVKCDSSAIVKATHEINKKEHENYEDSTNIKTESRVANNDGKYVTESAEVISLEKIETDTVSVNAKSNEAGDLSPLREKEERITKQYPHVTSGKEALEELHTGDKEKEKYVYSVSDKDIPEPTSGCNTTAMKIDENDNYSCPNEDKVTTEFKEANSGADDLNPDTSILKVGIAEESSPEDRAEEKPEDNIDFSLEGPSVEANEQRIRSEEQEIAGKSFDFLSVKESLEDPTLQKHKGEMNMKFSGPHLEEHEHESGEHECKVTEHKKEQIVQMTYLDNTSKDHESVLTAERSVKDEEKKLEGYSYVEPEEIGHNTFETVKDQDNAAQEREAKVHTSVCESSALQEFPNKPVKYDMHSYESDKASQMDQEKNMDIGNMSKEKIEAECCREENDMEKRIVAHVTPVKQKHEDCSLLDDEMQGKVSPSVQTWMKTEDTCTGLKKNEKSDEVEEQHNAHRDTSTSVVTNLQSDENKTEGTGEESIQTEADENILQSDKDTDVGIENISHFVPKTESALHISQRSTEEALQNDEGQENKVKELSASLPEEKFLESTDMSKIKDETIAHRTFLTASTPKGALQSDEIVAEPWAALGGTEENESAPVTHLTEEVEHKTDKEVPSTMCKDVGGSMEEDNQNKSSSEIELYVQNISKNDKDLEVETQKTQGRHPCEDHKLELGKKVSKALYADRTSEKETAQEDETVEPHEHQENEKLVATAEMIQEEDKFHEDKDIHEVDSQANECTTLWESDSHAQESTKKIGADFEPSQMDTQEDASLTTIKFSAREKMNEVSPKSTTEKCKHTGGYEEGNLKAVTQSDEGDDQKPDDHLEPLSFGEEAAEGRTYTEKEHTYKEPNCSEVQETSTHEEEKEGDKLEEEADEQIPDDWESSKLENLSEETKSAHINKEKRKDVIVLEQENMKTNDLNKENITHEEHPDENNGLLLVTHELVKQTLEEEEEAGIIQKEAARSDPEEVIHEPINIHTIIENRCENHETFPTELQAVFGRTEENESASETHLKKQVECKTDQGVSSTVSKDGGGSTDEDTQNKDSSEIELCVQDISKDDRELDVPEDPHEHLSFNKSREIMTLVGDDALKEGTTDAIKFETSSSPQPTIEACLLNEHQENEKLAATVEMIQEEEKFPKDMDLCEVDSKTNECNALWVSYSQAEAEKIGADHEPSQIDTQEDGSLTTIGSSEGEKMNQEASKRNTENCQHTVDNKEGNLKAVILSEERDSQKLGNHHEPLSFGDDAAGGGTYTEKGPIYIEAKCSKILETNTQEEEMEGDKLEEEVDKQIPDVQESSKQENLSEETKNTQIKKEKSKEGIAPEQEVQNKRTDDFEEENKTNEEHTDKSNALLTVTPDSVEEILEEVDIMQEGTLRSDTEKAIHETTNIHMTIETRCEKHEKYPAELQARIGRTEENESPSDTHLIEQVARARDQEVASTVSQDAGKSTDEDAQDKCCAEIELRAQDIPKSDRVLDMQDDEIVMPHEHLSINNNQEITTLVGDDVLKETTDAIKFETSSSPQSSEEKCPLNEHQENEKLAATAGIVRTGTQKDSTLTTIESSARKEMNEGSPESNTEKCKDTVGYEEGNLKTATQSDEGDGEPLSFGDEAARGDAYTENDHKWKVPNCSKTHKTNTQEEGKEGEKLEEEADEEIPDNQESSKLENLGDETKNAHMKKEKSQDMIVLEEKNKRTNYLKEENIAHEEYPDKSMALLPITHESMEETLGGEVGIMQKGTPRSNNEEGIHETTNIHMTKGTRSVAHEKPPAEFQATFGRTEENESTSGSHLKEQVEPARQQEVSSTLPKDAHGNTDEDTQNKGCSEIALCIQDISKDDRELDVQDDAIVVPHEHLSFNENQEIITLVGDDALKNGTTDAIKFETSSSVKSTEGTEKLRVTAEMIHEEDQSNKDVDLYHVNDQAKKCNTLWVSDSQAQESSEKIGADYNQSLTDTQDDGSLTSIKSTEREKMNQGTPKLSTEKCEHIESYEDGNLKALTHSDERDGQKLDNQSSFEDDAAGGGMYTEKEHIHKEPKCSKLHETNTKQEERKGNEIEEEVDEQIPTDQQSSKLENLIKETKNAFIKKEKSQDGIVAEQVSKSTNDFTEENLTNKEHTGNSNVLLPVTHESAEETLEEEVVFMQKEASSSDVEEAINKTTIIHMTPEPKGENHEKSPAEPQATFGRTEENEPKSVTHLIEEVGHVRDQEDSPTVSKEAGGSIDEDSQNKSSSRTELYVRNILKDEKDHDAERPKSEGRHQCEDHKLEHDKRASNTIDADRTSEKVTGQEDETAVPHEHLSFNMSPETIFLVSDDVLNEENEETSDAIKFETSSTAESTRVKYLLNEHQENEKLEAIAKMVQEENKLHEDKECNTLWESDCQAEESLKKIGADYEPSPTNTQEDAGLINAEFSAREKMNQEAQSDTEECENPVSYEEGNLKAGQKLDNHPDPLPFGDEATGGDAYTEKTHIYNEPNCSRILETNTKEETKEGDKLAEATDQQIPDDQESSKLENFSEETKNAKSQDAIVPEQKNKRTNDLKEENMEYEEHPDKSNALSPVTHVSVEETLEQDVGIMQKQASTSDNEETINETTNTHITTDTKCDDYEKSPKSLLSDQDHGTTTDKESTKNDTPNYNVNSDKGTLSSSDIEQKEDKKKDEEHSHDRKKNDEGEERNIEVSSVAVTEMQTNDKIGDKKYQESSILEHGWTHETEEETCIQVLKASRENGMKISGKDAPDDEEETYVKQEQSFQEEVRETRNLDKVVADTHPRNETEKTADHAELNKASGTKMVHTSNLHDNARDLPVIHELTTTAMNTEVDQMNEATSFICEEKMHGNTKREEITKNDVTRENEKYKGGSECEPVDKDQEMSYETGVAAIKNSALFPLQIFEEERVMKVGSQVEADKHTNKEAETCIDNEKLEEEGTTDKETSASISEHNFLEEEKVEKDSEPAYKERPEIVVIHDIEEERKKQENSHTSNFEQNLSTVPTVLEMPAEDVNTEKQTIKEQGASRDNNNIIISHLMLEQSLKKDEIEAKYEEETCETKPKDTGKVESDFIPMVEGLKQMGDKEPAKDIIVETNSQTTKISAHEDWSYEQISEHGKIPQTVDSEEELTSVHLQVNQRNTEHESNIAMMRIMENKEVEETKFEATVETEPFKDNEVQDKPGKKQNDETTGSYEEVTQNHEKSLRAEVSNVKSLPDDPANEETGCLSSSLETSDENSSLTSSGSGKNNHLKNHTEDIEDTKENLLEKEDSTKVHEVASISEVCEETFQDEKQRENRPEKEKAKQECEPTSNTADEIPTGQVKESVSAPSKHNPEAKNSELETVCDKVEKSTDPLSERDSHEAVLGDEQHTKFGLEEARGGESADEVEGLRTISADSETSDISNTSNLKDECSPGVNINPLVKCIVRETTINAEDGEQEEEVCHSLLKEHSVENTNMKEVEESEEITEPNLVSTSLFGKKEITKTRDEVPSMNPSLSSHTAVSVEEITFEEMDEEFVISKEINISSASDDISGAEISDEANDFKMSSADLLYTTIIDTANAKEESSASFLLISLREAMGQEDHGKEQAEDFSLVPTEKALQNTNSNEDKESNSKSLEHNLEMMGSSEEIETKEYWDKGQNKASTTALPDDDTTSPEVSNKFEKTYDAPLEVPKDEGIISNEKKLLLTPVNICVKEDLNKAEKLEMVYADSEPIVVDDVADAKNALFQDIPSTLVATEVVGEAALYNEAEKQEMDSDKSVLSNEATVGSASFHEAKEFDKKSVKQSPEMLVSSEKVETKEDRDESTCREVHVLTASELLNEEHKFVETKDVLKTTYVALPEAPIHEDVMSDEGNKDFSLEAKSGASGSAEAPKVETHSSCSAPTINTHITNQTYESVSDVGQCASIVKRELGEVMAYNKDGQQQLEVCNVVFNEQIFENTDSEEITISEKQSEFLAYKQVSLAEKLPMEEREVIKTTEDENHELAKFETSQNDQDKEMEASYLPVSQFLIDRIMREEDDKSQIMIQEENTEDGRKGVDNMKQEGLDLPSDKHIRIDERKSQNTTEVPKSCDAQELAYNIDEGEPYGNARRLPAMETLVEDVKEEVFMSENLTDIVPKDVEKHETTEKSETQSELKIGEFIGPGLVSNDKRTDADEQKATLNDNEAWAKNPDTASAAKTNSNKMLQEEVCQKFVEAKEIQPSIEMLEKTTIENHPRETMAIIETTDFIGIDETHLNTQETRPVLEVNQVLGDALEFPPEGKEIKTQIDNKHDEITDAQLDGIVGDPIERTKLSHSGKAHPSGSEKDSMDDSNQNADNTLEEKSLAINRDELNKEAIDMQVDEDKSDEEDGKDDEEHEIDKSGTGAPVTELIRDEEPRTAHKKSHNILSGVKSKVKHSLAKVKKAITGKSSHSKTKPPK